jgi:type II secretory pathway pseudopilin PulG
LSENQSQRDQGFTVLELLTALAFLVVIMGLMVSLARYVRSNAAEQITRRTLEELQARLDQYYQRFGVYPPGQELPEQVDEKSVNVWAQQTEPIWVTALGKGLGETSEVVPTRDAWGKTIGYLMHHHPFIGMAPQNRPFFFSAGPDAQYLTRQDNFYSYEQVLPVHPSPRSGLLKPGGHSE